MTAACRAMNLFVVGATGRTGRELVDQAVARGHRVTALVRSPEKLVMPRDGLTALRGDPLSPEAIGRVLAGHDAVLSAIGPPGPGRTTVVQDSARAIVTAMKATGTRRLIVLSVALLFPGTGLIGAALRRTFLRGVADDSQEMEQIVRATELDWTIVRPPRLTNGARTESYAGSVDRLPPGSGGGAASISRADVAHFLLDEVERPAHVGRLVGIAYAKGALRRRDHVERMSTASYPSPTEPDRRSVQ
jgi:putative NADH-flavin reductase